MAFTYRKDVGGSGSSNDDFVTHTLANSETFAVGDVIETFTNGFGANPAAAVPVLGVVISLSDGVLPEVKGTHTAGATNTSDLQTVTTAADNETTGKFKAQVNVSETAVYSATVSGTLGTTNDSDLRGGRVDIDSANTSFGQVLETTFTRSFATAANFYSHGVDPSDSTKLLLSIAQSETRSPLA